MLDLSSREICSAKVEFNVRKSSHGEFEEVGSFKGCCETCSVRVLRSRVGFVISVGVVSEVPLTVATSLLRFSLSTALSGAKRPGSEIHIF